VEVGIPTVERQKRIVVAGATGYLGRHVVQALHRHGWWVRALARDEARLGKARASCDEVFVGHATRRDSLAGLCEGADVVFSSIGVRNFRRRPTYEEVDFGANRDLVELAESAGVERFVFVSLLDGEEHRSASRLVDARERVVDRLRRSSMQATVLRPTGFFNDMGEVFEMARRGRVWLIGSGESRINPIHGADLAQVVASIVQADRPEPEVPVGGPEVFSQREIAELAFRTLGKAPRYGHAGPGVLRFAAALLRPFNANASALARMFALLGERDAVGPPHGDHRLEDHFEGLAKGLPGERR
jgi:uncharacterized protein YbjT (DUF2867 family)